MNNILTIDYDNIRYLINNRYITFNKNKKVLYVNPNKINYKSSFDTLIIKIKEIEILSWECHLKYLDITEVINLKQLYCSDNQLQELNINNNINLVHLDCSNNQLYKLNTNNNINLEYLDCGYNQLKEPESLAFRLKVCLHTLN